MDVMTNNSNHEFDKEDSYSEPQISNDKIYIFNDHHKGNDLKDLEKRLGPLNIYNKQYKHTLEILTADIKDIDRSLEHYNEKIEARNNKKQQQIVEIDKLKIKHDTLISEINNIRLMIKASQTDEDNTLHLIESLLDELEEFKHEKLIAIDKIKTMKDAIKLIASEKERNLPKLKHFDAMLKKAYTVFQETESRMDLSIKLKKLIPIVEH
nr:magnetosome protein Mad26-2 [Desulfobacteraceae bacterium]